jgi:phospholipase D1/2
VKPENHIFVFNLRSFDRLNTTSAMKEQEEKSGVKYQEVQRAEAEEVMSSGLRGENCPASPSGGPPDSDDSGQIAKEQVVDRKRQFEAHREAVGLDQEQIAEDSIAKSAMLGQTKVVNEPWETDNPDLEWDNFVQEELYIHGKVLIVDDRTVICGSSNINDRSQLGFHDSELSIVMTDTKLMESTMDGQPFRAGHHAATLRRMLWREHLGLLPPESLDASKDPNAQPPGDGPNENLEGEEYEFVADPLSDKVWDMWTGNATTNTQVFRDLFHADPDDSIKTFEDYEAFTPNPKVDKEHKQGHLYVKPQDMSIQEVKKQLDRIRGHLVWMPLDFLCNAEMAEKGLQVNEYTESIYT